MTFRRRTCSLVVARVLPAMAVVLASLVAQVRGVMFYDYGVSGACWGDNIYLVQRPNDRYDVNFLDVRLIRSRPYLLGHLAASPLMRDLSLEVSG